MYIYKIENKKTKKVYIGVAKNFEKRKNRHIRYLKKNEHHSKYLQNSWNKHGAECFEFSVINKFENITYAQLLKKEIEYISKYDSFKNGYNGSIGGEGVSGYFGKYHWNSIPIYQYDINGIFVKKWENCQEIENELKYQKSTITYASKSNNNFACGFFWTRNFLGIFTYDFHKIFQYDLYGNFVKSFYSVRYVEEEYKIRASNVDRCWRGYTNTAYGFQWIKEYKGDKIESTDRCSHEKVKEQFSKKVYQYTKDKKILLNAFDSVSDAGRFLKKDPSSISACCNKKLNSAFKYWWSFEKNI